MVAEDVIIHAGGNMGFLEQLGDGGHSYRRVKIVRKPGSTGPMALNADGFHSTSVRVGPTLLSNVAERFGGLHVYTEQEWLEGDLGMANVQLENNTFVVRRSGDRWDTSPGSTSW